MASSPLLETVWIDKSIYDEAEREYYQRLNKPIDSIPIPAKPIEQQPPKNNREKHSKKNKKGNANSTNVSESENQAVVAENTVVKESKPVQEKPSKGNKKGNKKDQRKSEPRLSESNTSTCVPDKGDDSSQVICSQSSLASEVAKARQHIKNSLECMDTVLSSVNNSFVSNVNSDLAEMKNMLVTIKQEVETLKKQVAALTISQKKK